MNTTNGQSIPQTEIIDNNSLVNNAVQIIDKARQNISSVVFNETTKAYFLLGKLIIEEEQNGSGRAEYGKAILSNLSKALNIKYGKGFSVSTLRDCRQFYVAYQKQQTLSGELNFKLNFSQYVILMRQSELERVFYEQLAITERYNVRELGRAIDSNMMYRIMKDKENRTLETSNSVTNAGNTKNEIVSVRDIIKDPFVAEFLGFNSFVEGEESKLEQALIDNLEKFLLELGRGFAFVGRQYALNISGDVFKADLVFYNIQLRRYVIFELKSKKAEHKDIGQLQMYVNYFDREICNKLDNPTIGILLCKEKNQTVIDYTLPIDNQTIFSSELKLYLPSKEELEKFLE